MIKLTFEPEFHRVALYDGNNKIGECTYVDHTTHWELNHTEVDPQYKGQGLGKKLVEELVNQGKKQGVHFIPTCPFVVKEFEENSDYQAYLYKK